ncbi:MAG: hypothetical protein LBL39_02130 [Planctomycetaceae bacterium]|jgi:hypothetical protein|nr:hypothetical protein [Planctomycetaceae bacterium]
MDNPVQVQRSTGLRRLPQRNCVAVQHVHGKDKRFRLNYYVVPVGVVALPRAALRLHGVIHVKVLRTWESQVKNLTFILTFRERLQYAKAILKFAKLNTVAQQREAVTRGRSLLPYRLRYNFSMEIQTKQNFNPSLSYYTEALKKYHINHTNQINHSLRQRR